MSYDLFFRSRTANQALSKEDFVSYFGRRRYYELNDSQAWYSNEDSGVYFVFEYDKECQESDAEAGIDLQFLPVSFNLNYFRPHVFGLEAEPEVATFVSQFNLMVSDPQMSGMGDGEYSQDGFLKGWNAGNDFGYRGVLSQETTKPILTLPSRQIEAYWNWNYRRESVQSELGESAFVPRIFFFDVEGSVCSAVAWADGIPILLPTVDQVIVPRQRLAARSWLRSKDDVVVFAWKELERPLEKYRNDSGDLSCYELFYDLVPAEIERLIRGKRPPNKMPIGVSFDQVLNRELVEEAVTKRR